MNSKFLTLLDFKSWLCNDLRNIWIEGRTVAKNFFLETAAHAQFDQRQFLIV